MATFEGPVLVRNVLESKPGFHSHNLSRTFEAPPKQRKLFIIRLILLVLGLCGIGYYGYEAVDQYVYQAYQNWAFDQEINGHRVTFIDYLRQQTPFGFLVGTAKPEAPAIPAIKSAPSPAIPAPAYGSLLGRVVIGRLNISAIVREGVDAATLSRAVGHVPSTGLAGQTGNFAIAAHRDTLFRALKDIHQGDLVNFQSSTGTYTYQVFSTKVVKPSDVSVLRADGGFAPGSQAVQASQGSNKLLTMITCYPFYYIGSAPKRFIVQARLVSTEPGKSVLEESAQTGSPPGTDAATHSLHRITKTRPIQHASLTEPRHPRGSSSFKHDQNSLAKHNKRGFWHKLLHPRENAASK